MQLIWSKACTDLIIVDCIKSATQHWHVTCELDLPIFRIMVLLYGEPYAMPVNVEYAVMIWIFGDISPLCDVVYFKLPAEKFWHRVCFRSTNCKIGIVFVSNFINIYVLIVYGQSVWFVLNCTVNQRGMFLLCGTWLNPGVLFELAVVVPLDTFSGFCDMNKTDE